MDRALRIESLPLRGVSIVVHSRQTSQWHCYHCSDWGPIAPHAWTRVNANAHRLRHEAQRTYPGPYLRLVPRLEA